MRDCLCRSNFADEVNDNRDRAVATQTYARQSNDRDMIEHATEIRLRAERRAGQLLEEMKATGERARGSGDRRKESQLAILSDLGLTATQSSRWQKLGALDDEAFERRAVVAKRQAVVRGGDSSGASDREKGTPCRAHGHRGDQRLVRARACGG